MRARWSCDSWAGHEIAGARTRDPDAEQDQYAAKKLHETERLVEQQPAECRSREHHRCVGSVRQKSDYVALQAVASRSAVFRSSAAISLTRDGARRDLGAATAIA